MDVVATREIALTQDSSAPAQSPSVPNESAFAHALPRIYGYFYPRVGGSHALAEDLTQDTMLSAIRSSSTPRQPDEMMPWLFHIARNKLIDHYRQQDRKRRHLGAEVDEEDIGVQPGLPDLDLESLPIREEVIATLATLNPRYRTAIVLRYFDGCEVALVAEALFVSPSAAESLLARARNAFRASWIARNGDTR